MSLLLAALIAVGVFVVHREARRAQQVKLDVMLTFADASMNSVRQAMRAALDSLQLAGPAVGRSLSPRALMNIPDARFSDWFSLDEASSGLTLTFWYSGHLVRVYPPLPPAVMADLQQRSTLDYPPANVSYPATSPVPYMRINTLWGMATGNVVVAGSDYVAVGSSIEILLLLTMPVHGNATSVNETWGWPANMTAPECITGNMPCFNPVAGKKWWGQVNIALGREQLSNALGMHRLSGSGYGYSLSLVQDTPGLATPAAQGPTLLFTNLDRMTCASTSTKSTGTLAFQRLTLDLEVCIVAGWSVPWERPLYAMVVLVLFSTTVMLGIFVITRMHHSDLVRGLLSDAAIQHLSDNLPANAIRRSSDATLSGSPADKLVTILTMLAEGQSPPISDVMLILASLKNRTNLYLPGNLEQHVRRAAGTDVEVADALMATLMPESGPGGSHAPTSLSGQDRVIRTSLLYGRMSLTRLDEQGYLDLPDALIRITGLKRALSAAAVHDTPRRCSEEFLMKSFGLTSKSSFHHTTHDNLMFSDVDCEDMLGSSLPISGARPASPLLTKLELSLAGAVSLAGDFDVWELADASNGHPLSALGYWCFHQSGILYELQLTGHKLAKFLLAIESGYRSNPYHNKTHAADVLQTVYALLHTGGLRGKYADNFTTVACFLAAVIHDYDHRGVTNDFLITTRNQLALTYNDRSPHENHHASAGLTLLNVSENNFLEHMTVAEASRMRKLVVDLVLATDMKQHFAINSTFTNTHRLATAALVQRITAKAQAAVQLNAHVVAAVDRRASLSLANDPVRRSYTRDGTAGLSGLGHSVVPRTATGGPSVATASTKSGTGDLETGVSGACASDDASGAESGPLPVDEAERLLTLQMMLKCADLGHLCTSLPIHLKWVTALEEEMFQQGDKEREQGLPISPLCDRSHSGLGKSQVGFFDVVVLPLLTNFTTRFPATRPILNAAVANYKHWQAAQAAAANPGT